MTTVCKDEFLAFLKRHPLAIPDGFKAVGSYIQTKWMEGEVEVARESKDGFGTIFEVRYEHPH